MKYYKHIDGLRALAVLLVVFFHLDIHYIKSGFLGVDIFFVISGFLIISILIRDLQNDSFSLKNFYLRRMRRILPALIFVLIFTTIFAWLILLPQDLKNYSKTLVSALGSFSNLYFFKYLSFGYFSTDASVIPLLHTWSLGIEEQFYVFWPITLIFIFGVNIRWKDFPYASIYKRLLFICVLLIVFSIFCFVWKKSPKYYYFPVTRAFELLFGCFVAIVTMNKEVVLNKLISNILSIVALGLMLIPILFVNVKYPGIGTVEVCFGAALFIYVGLNSLNNSIIHRVFSIKPLVAIGLISYSLYLWHWPIIAYINYLSIEKTHLVKIIVFIVSVLLAALTYFLIEKPFRHKIKMSFTKTLILLWIVPIAFACCFALGSKYIKTFGFNNIPKNIYQEANKYYGILKQEYGCIDFKVNNIVSPNLPPSKLCRIGDISKKENQVLIVGDSHAMAGVGMLNVFLKNAHLSAYVVTNSGSPFILGAGIINWRENKPVDRSKKIADLIEKEHYKYVVMGGFWNYYTDLPSSKFKKAKPFKVLEKGLMNATKFIVDNNSIPVFILDVPSTIDLKRYCGLQRISFLKCFNSKSVVQQNQEKTKNILLNIKKHFPSTILIDPNKIICDNSHCYTSYRKTPFYMSDGVNSHLSYVGSELVGELYLKRYGNPLM